MINIDIRKLMDDIKKIAKHWGFGEIDSSIYAVIVTSERPLTAYEISNKIGYAYSSTINALNQMVRAGFLEKKRENGKNVYLPTMDFVDIIRKDSENIRSLLQQIANRIHSLEGKYKQKFESLLQGIEKAIGYLERAKMKEGSNA